uniref:Coiled-coil domain-containing protein n=1 Tax=Timema douglasi TaxID=61478 RepID=A0A7R8ZB82_TIMDO|nr:unnamed protein product [Timema douglasi]
MDNIINKNLTVHSDNYKESMFSSRIQGAPQKYSWKCKTADEKHRTNNSEKWPNVLDELLKAELISGQQLLRLKDNHCVVTCDPNIIMDLRHEEVKKNRKAYRQGCSKHDIIEEAKRMVKNEEIEKLTQKKESNLIEKEISNFKKQLEIDISRSQETLKRSDKSIHNDLPPILLNMEERRKAREQKWQLIKEKKRLIKEEREKKIQEEEEERQRKDNEAKMKRLEELREKRLREKEIALQREFEREHLKMMVIKATDHYKKYLMVKYGLRPLKKLLMLQAQQASHAELHYQKTVMNNHFQNWRTSVQTCLQQRFDKAISHYHHKLSEKCFNTWLLVYDNSIRKYQVAIDLYDLNLTARIFRDWHCYVCAQHLEMGLKHEKAVNHCKRKILVKCLRDWTKLPEVAKLEQEKEMRKNVWRKKVQEVLPDFNPPSYS